MTAEQVIPDSRRAYHTLLAASFAIAYAADFRHLQIHTAAGYGAALLLTGRLLIEAARGTRFQSYRFSFADVKSHLSGLLAGRPADHGIHNPSSGTMALVLTALLAACVASGILAFGAKELEGPAASILEPYAWILGGPLESLHAFLARTILVLLVLHISGAVYESIRGRRNWVRMIFVDNQEKNI